MDKATDRLLSDIESARPETPIDRLRAGYVRSNPFELSQADRERIAAAKAKHYQTACEMVTRAMGGAR